MVRKGGSEINWEIGIDMYTLLCITYITNENVLYSTGNATKCSVVTQMGRKSEKEGGFALLYSRKHNFVMQLYSD